VTCLMSKENAPTISLSLEILLALKVLPRRHCLTRASLSHRNVKWVRAKYGRKAVKVRHIASNSVSYDERPLLVSLRGEE